ncbi:MAG: glycosyltransferase [Anaerolineae bacterium]|nr:glycosyltransferase [Anaerolineae bacterium]
MHHDFPVSVVIPSFQSARTIVACLEAVFNQKFDKPFEVIVVDSSTDETATIVRKQFPRVTIIALSQQTLPGPARNLGLQQARGDIIVFLDSDCVPAPDWLQRMVATHAAGHTIVGGAVLNGTPDNAVGWAGYISEFREFLPQGEARMVGHLPTCNISYRSDLFDKYGGFPNEYYPQEDLLFNWQLGQLGESILFDPAIQVAHLNRTQFSSFLTHQRRIGRATTQVLRLTDLPGAWLARRWGLALLGLPFMTILKFVNTLRVFWRWRISSVVGQPLAWLLVALGLINWAIGFSAGLKVPSASTDQIQIFATLKSKLV